LGGLPRDRFIPLRTLPIFDSGYSLNLSIREEHLENWAGIKVSSLRVIGRTRINKQNLPLHRATIALHPNVAGKRDIFRGEPPYELRLREGIVVYPRGDPLAPRLPLLGARALVQNDLITIIDGQRRELTFRTRWRLFG